MKKILISSVATLLMIGSITACTNRDMGMATGGVIGGIAGNALTGGSTAGTVVGAVGGAFVGRSMTH